jgi:dynein heavy chain
MPLAVWELFINKCRMNLHIVLNLSPVGEKLRLRIRNFPSFVNCTSTIWIFPWSEGALFSVASHFLEDQTSILFIPFILVVTLDGG